jgi:nickel-dependent lactate racemase
MPLLREVALPRGSAVERAALPAGVPAEELTPARAARTAAPDAAAQVRQALRRPLGGLAGNCIPARALVLVVVPDATRAAFLPATLPALLDELEAQGIQRRQVQLAVACGAHRPPTPGEARALLGAEAGRRVVHLHDAARGPHFPLGRTRRGTPVELDDALREAEAVLTLGPVAWHYFAGFGGGPKLIFPGLASRRAIQANHALTLGPPGGGFPLQPGCAPGVLEGNPVAEDLREAAALLRVDYELSFVAGDQGPAEAWAGPPPRAQRAAECWLLERAAVGEPAAYDVVLASAGGAPHDLDWVQSHKALLHACRYARPGARVVLVAECGRGTGSPSFDAAAALPPAEAHARLLRQFALNGQTALSTRWHAERYRVTLVTRLAEERVRALGFEHATDLASALRAMDWEGSPRVACLPRATDVIPRAASR